MGTKDRISLGRVTYRLAPGLERSRPFVMNSFNMSSQILLLDGLPTIGALLSLQEITRYFLRRRHLSAVPYKSKSVASESVEACLRLETPPLGKFHSSTLTLAFDRLPACEPLRKIADEPFMCTSKLVSKSHPPPNFSPRKGGTRAPKVGKTGRKR